MRSTTPTANVTLNEDIGVEMAPIESKLIKLEKTKDKTANMQQHLFMIKQPEKASNESTSLSLAGMSQSTISFVAH